MANLYLSLGEYQKAIKYYEKSLEINAAIGDRSGIAGNYRNLGSAYSYLGEYQKAINHCQKALEISTAIGDKLDIATGNGTTPSNENTTLSNGPSPPIPRMAKPFAACTPTVQEVGNVTTMSIPTRITARKFQPFFTTYRNHYRPCGSNILNLKNIVIHKPNACITKSSKSHLPSFCCINARSLLPKIDELTLFLSCRQPSVVAVTESWLNSDIEDGLVSINGYNIFRKDRPSRRGGGICVYLPHGTYAKRRLDLEHENLECLWLWLRPTRLPRPLSGIAVCIIYHPPGLPVENHHQFNEYLILTIDSLRNQHPNCGLVLLGDFNDFDIANILSSHNLKQVVKVHTRGTAILDLIITNQPNLYEPPQVLAPLGSSDHNIVTWSPNLKNTNSQERTKSVKRCIRRYPRSGIEALGRWIATHDWFGELGTNHTVDDLTSSFSSHLTEAINRIFPPITVKCHQTDKPWITPGIKKLIKDRQKAFHNHNIPVWKSLRYKVQEEIKQRKKSFYKNNVQHLKNSDSRKWWKIINKMSGKPGTTKPFTLERDGEILNNLQASNALNEFYTSVTADIPPLDVNLLPSFLPSNDSVPAVECYQVCKKLQSVHPFKAPGPDNISPRILKEYAHMLAEPITIIFNISLASGVVPSSWKESNIVPIPKTVNRLLKPTLGLYH